MSSRRLIETGLLSLASPFISDARLKGIARLSPELAAALDRWHATPHARMFLTPHMAHWETLTWLWLLRPEAKTEVGVIFRPLDNPTANAFITSTRERFGMTLLSRKEGFQQALKIMRRHGTVGILFDQNAGLQGALTTLLGRVCATTELPGILAEKFSADCIALYPRRLGFWQVEIHYQGLGEFADGAQATLALNRWLSHALTTDERLCGSWLWSHDRWRNQDMPSKRLRLEAKRDLLPLEAETRGGTPMPRKTRVFIRLPNWLGDVVMAIPHLRAIRAGRPDAELTLIGKAAFAPLVATLGLADHYEPLPKQGWGYFAHFWALRRRYPDAYILFTNSVRGDLEAWLTRCRQRFGLVRPGKRRPLLSHRFEVPTTFDERVNHQEKLWELFLRHFGLEAPLDHAPIPPVVAATGPATVGDRPIGLICGSENLPAKRWPVAHWRALITALPEHRFVLFGTPGDRPLTEEVAAGLPAARVDNLAGRTTLPAYMDALRGCRLLVTNDTGGMHLANALGVPLIALFGPTNPLRTGPVFSAPHTVLQPPGCPPHGGGDLALLSPENVVQSVRSVMERADTPNTPAN